VVTALKHQKEKRSTQKSSAIHKLAGRLPHLFGVKRTSLRSHFTDGILRAGLNYHF
jgi:hypothetical protein